MDAGKGGSSDFFFFQAEDGIRDYDVTGVQTCALPIYMAYSMLHQPSFRRALDLQKVPAKRRERYGQTNFGQSLLLARQLIEAGISLVTVNFDHESKHDKRSPLWDTHHDNFAKLKDPLCPLFDQAFSAFIEDLSDSGLLDSTLVVEIGRASCRDRV